MGVVGNGTLSLHSYLLACLQWWAAAVSWCGLLEGSGDLSGFLEVSQLSCCSPSLGQTLLCLSLMGGIFQMFLCQGVLDGVPWFFPPLCTEHVGIDLNIAGKGPRKSYWHVFGRTLALYRVIFENSSSDLTPAEKPSSACHGAQVKGYELYSLEPLTLTFRHLFLICLPGPRPLVLRADVLFCVYR